MPTLPDTGILLVRTDFADEHGWEQVREEAGRDFGGLPSPVRPINDPAWAGVRWKAVKATVPAGPATISVLYIADSITFASAEHSVLAVSLQH